VDPERIRQRCREDFARRYREDEEDTLLTCPACDGSKLTRVDIDDAGSYQMFSCPWCDGRGVTSTQMVALYRTYLQAGGE